MKPLFLKWLHGLSSTGILLIFILGIYSVLVQPALFSRKINTERMEDLIFRIERFSSSHKDLDSLEKEIEYLVQQNTNLNDFLRYEEPAIAAANLQKNIKTAIETGGGKLISTHMLNQEIGELFPKVTIKIHMRATVGTLRSVLYHLTSNSPVLFIKNMVIQNHNAHRGEKQQADSQLEIKFDVDGYINRRTT